MKYTTNFRIPSISQKSEQQHKENAEKLSKISSAVNHVQIPVNIISNLKVVT